MSNTALAGIDDKIMHAFQAVGLADAATYVSRNGLTTIACRVYIDRDVQTSGDFGQVTGQKTTAIFLLAEVPSPESGATVTVGGDTWRLESRVTLDESTSQWMLNPGV